MTSEDHTQPGRDSLDGLVAGVSQRGQAQEGEGYGE